MLDTIKSILGIAIVSVLTGETCFAQNTQISGYNEHYFPKDSLIGIWGNCVTEFKRKIKKSKNSETIKIIRVTGNTCPEIHFNQDSTGSVKDEGSTEPSHIKFSWLIRNNILYISKLIKLGNYNSNYLSNGQYIISKKAHWHCWNINSGSTD